MGRAGPLCGLASHVDLLGYRQSGDAAQYELSRHSYHEGMIHSRSGTLRYQFPYMERRARRPDPPQLAQATVRAAVGAASGLLAELPLVAGGKSFGGRMTSQAQAKTPLQGVRGLAFLGFPLHPAGRPSQDRAEHLFDVQIPMLFLQGTRDTLASLDQLGRFAKNSAGVQR